MLFEFINSNNQTPSSNSEKSLSNDREVPTNEVAPINGIETPQRGTLVSNSDVKIPYASNL